MRGRLNYSGSAVVELRVNYKVCQCPEPRPIRKHLELKELGLSLITQGRTRTTENWRYLSRRVLERPHYRN